MYIPAQLWIQTQLPKVQSPALIPAGRIACRRVAGRLHIVAIEVAEDDHQLLLTGKLQKLEHLLLRGIWRVTMCEKLVAGNH